MENRHPPAADLISPRHTGGNIPVGCGSTPKPGALLPAGGFIMRLKQHRRRTENDVGLAETEPYIKLHKDGEPLGERSNLRRCARRILGVVPKRRHPDALGVFRRRPAGGRMDDLRPPRTGPQGDHHEAQPDKTIGIERGKP